MLGNRRDKLITVLTYWGGEGEGGDKGDKDG